MKLREGWKSHGRSWRYMETVDGCSVESVVQFVDRGQKRYEAHYWENNCCGFANSFADLWKCKKFNNREDAFIFCEEKYEQRMAEKRRTA